MTIHPAYAYWFDCQERSVVTTGASGVNAVRSDDWTIAEDGSLYTLPLDSGVIEIGRIDE